MNKWWLWNSFHISLFTHFIELLYIHGPSSSCRSQLIGLPSCFHHYTEALAACFWCHTLALETQPSPHHPLLSSGKETSLRVDTTLVNSEGKSVCLCHYCFICDVVFFYSLCKVVVLKIRCFYLSPSAQQLASSPESWLSASCSASFLLNMILFSIPSSGVLLRSFAQSQTCATHKAEIWQTARGALCFIVIFLCCLWNSSSSLITSSGLLHQLHMGCVLDVKFALKHTTL